MLKIVGTRNRKLFAKDDIEIPSFCNLNNLFSTQIKIISDNFVVFMEVGPIQSGKFEF